MKCPAGIFLILMAASVLFMGGMETQELIDKPVIVERSITPYESMYDEGWIEYRYSVNGIACVELLKNDADLKAYKAELREFGRFKGE